MAEAGIASHPIKAVEARCRILNKRQRIDEPGLPVLWETQDEGLEIRKNAGIKTRRLES